MDTHGKCEVCGQPGILHVTDVSGIETVQQSLYMDHVPEEYRERMLAAMPFGPHRTPEEEIAFLRKQIVLIEKQVADPTERAKYIAEVEQLIADIAAGRRRLGEAE